VQSSFFVFGINTLLQTVLGSRLLVVMGNSFYFLLIMLSIINAPRIIDIPDSHEVTDHPPLIVAHTPETSDLRNFPFNLYFYDLFLCLSPCLLNITNKRGIFFSFRFLEISTCNESDIRSFHCRFSAQQHTRIQRPMGHNCQVMKAGCLLTCTRFSIYCLRLDWSSSLARSSSSFMPKIRLKHTVEEIHKVGSELHSHHVS